MVGVGEAALRDPASVVDALHEAWCRRRPVVVALAVDPGRFREPVSHDVAEPWRLEPGFELWHDRLHFLVWANTYDARGGGEPIWWWARKATRLGAGALDEAPGDPDGVLGDVLLPDGTPAWIDGGPRGGLDPHEVGAALVHAESVEQGRLTLVPSGWPSTGSGAALVVAGSVEQGGLTAVPPQRSAAGPVAGERGADRSGGSPVGSGAGDVAPGGSIGSLVGSAAGELVVDRPGSLPARSGAVDLAPDQRRAVEHGAGPARVIAPAGSGKTRVLTERLRHLLAEREYERDCVVAVAYNRKARDEMVERTNGLGARVLTLNALGYELVAAGLGRRPDVIEPREVRRLLEPLVPRGARRLNTDPLAPYLDALGAVRLGLRDPAEVEEARGDVPGLTGAFPAYREQLLRRGVIDFDEQVLLAIELLLTDGRFRRAQQARHRHLLVDEFQDLTPAHVLLIRLLAAPRFDVFGVGDDDQVIYGHAGASPQFLTGFGRFFPGAREHALEVNYRCPAAVVTAARNLLTHNRVRVAKQIRPADMGDACRGGDTLDADDANSSGASAADDDGAPVAGDAGDVAGTGGDGGPRVASHAGGADDVAEASETGGGEARCDGALRVVRHEPRAGASELVALVRAWLAEPRIRPSDVAVLARVGSLLLAPQVAMVDAGLPVISSLRPDVLRRTGLRAALAYLRIALAPGQVDGRDLVEVYRRPSRGLPTWIERWLTRCRSIQDVAVAASRIDDAKVADRLDGLAGDLAQLAALARQGTTRAVLEHVRDAVGLGGVVELLDASGGGDGPSHRDDLEALLQVSDLHPDPAGFEAWLRSLLARPGDPTGVTLSTVHRVKGREWRRVALFGATDGLVPHRLAEGPAAREEERRVFHVAITRGIERVAVIADASRPSPFLAELEREAPPSHEPREPASLGATRGSPVPDDAPATRGRSRRGRRRERRRPAGKVAADNGVGVGEGGAHDSGDRPSADPGEPPADDRLVAALRAWRRDRSRADGVPAYVVLQDRHLTTIAGRRPTTLDELARCPGIGPVRLDAYGEEIVELLRSPVVSTAAEPRDQAAKQNNEFAREP